MRKKRSAGKVGTELPRLLAIQGASFFHDSHEKERPEALGTFSAGIKIWYSKSKREKVDR